MPGRDSDFGMAAKLQARTQAEWERRIAQATHSPDEILEIDNYAIDAQPLEEEPGLQMLRIVVATGRQIRLKIRPENAQALAWKINENAGLGAPPEDAPEPSGS